MARNPQILDLRRARAIMPRVRLIAAVFAVLTVAWIALDALVADGPTLAKLAALRVAAGTALGALSLACRLRTPSLAQVRLRLAALLVIPAAFFVVADGLVPAIAGDALRHAIIASYAYFPFLLAAGIAVFPLAWSEIALVSAVLAALEAWALAEGAAASAGGGIESLLLLALIAAASGIGAASQLRLLRALVDQAVRDPLTDCLRRETGTEVLEGQFGLAMRHGTPLAILFADIDRFKRVNDSFGHEAGDRVLAATASALRDVARETDALIRWGGEEFVMVLPHTGAREAVALIERLGRRGLGGLPDRVPVTVSIGVAHYPGDAAGDAHELVAMADRRMYLAKQAGRNRYVVDDDGDARLVVNESGGFAAAASAPVAP